ncbi:MAG TPA: hypothetical protein PLG79_13630 [Spirochaetales bacterium]|nr:hypothetical protein [Spirochaetales bacterium]
MERYRLETKDGLVHIIAVLSRDRDSLECEAFHSDGTRTLRIHQSFNRCLFELLLRLGIVQPLQEEKRILGKR